MDSGRLLALVAMFVPLSLVSLGGGGSIFADMHRQAVDVHGWLTDQEFADLFAISRAAPGPGSLVAALIGRKAAGFAGALVAALALYVPTSVLMYATGLWWHGARHQVLRRAIERGLRPVAVGLILAGSYRILQADGAGWLQVGTAAATVWAGLRGWGPYWLLAGVALVFGGLGWVQGV